MGTDEHGGGAGTVTHEDIAEEVAGLRSALVAHVAHDERTRLQLTSRVEINTEILKKVDLAFFGEDGTGGMSSRMARVENLVALGVRLGSLIGGATLLTIIAIFFRLLFGGLAP